MKYELTYKRIGDETIKMLNEELVLLLDNPKKINTKEVFVFQNSVEIINNCQSFNSNNHLNSALQYKNIAYDVAIFCVLGLNPDAAIVIRKQYHSKHTRSTNNILMHMLDTSVLHELVDDFAKCEGNPIEALSTEKLINDLLRRGVIKIIEDSSNSNKKLPKKRKYSTEMKQKLINKFARTEMEKNPTLNKGELATLLEEKYSVEIKVGFEQIRRAYLSKYPHF